ncbi:(d)CMP kinase [Candidatus Collierbacteria bacterium]|nr:(d)CMP kinase [Candidatus Collierbacteria bacterium]
MPVKSLHIAIDGPIGSGKSTVAKEISRRLDIFLIDAGAIYRTAAYIALRDNLNPNQAGDIAKKLRNSELVERQALPKEQDGRKITVLLDGKDISWEIRGHGIDDLVAKIAVNKVVINAVHAKEKLLAKGQSVVIEGREIGTMVLPKAQVKVYLTADPRERAKRRFQEYQNKGDTTPHGEIIRALKERDELDMRRAYAPLRKADDAVLVDTTGKTVNEVVDMILKLVPEEYFEVKYKKVQESKRK